MAKLTPAQQAEVTRQLQQRRSMLRAIGGLLAVGVAWLGLLGVAFPIVVGATVLWGVLVAALAAHHRRVVAAVIAHGWDPS